MSEARAIVTYCWAGSRDYAPWQVNVLARLCAEHAPAHRFICVTDGFDTTQFDASIEIIDTPRHVIDLSMRESPEGERFPSSYRRLWTFSEDFHRIVGDTLVMLLDVDCIPCGSMRHLFDRDEDFVGWRPRSRWGEPGRLAGGTWLHRLGTLQYVWARFAADPEAAIAAARTAGYRGSDQAWLSFLLAATAASWAEPHGIYQSQDYGRLRKKKSASKVSERRPLTVADARARRREYVWDVPEDACLLHFNGHTKPWHSDADFVRALYVPHAEREPGYLQLRRHLQTRTA